MTDRMAPGHVYQPKLGSGIEWKPGLVSLWDGGTMVATAPQATASAWEYFHALKFAESFPAVTHWWFRSAWTQRVRLTGIQGWMDATTPWGYMQFVDDTVPAGMWSIAEGERLQISVPFPPNEIQPVNLPLRLALARLVAGVIHDEVPPDTWLVVTSLVRREELALALPDSLDALPWQLEEVDVPIRAALCSLQGLKPPR